MEHSPAFLALVNDARTRVQTMDIDDFIELTESGEPYLLVDVREDREFEAAHAAGAIHLGKGVIERDIERTVPDKEAKLVLYCGGGYRSVLAAESLQKMGYGKAISLDGGWRSYQQAGLPVE